MMKPANQVKVFIDYRETNPILLQALDDHPNFHPHIGYLPTGDYQIESFLLVERKTCQDFSLSLMQGRLFRQATRLCREVQERKVGAAILIVEGKEDEFLQFNISREAILGAMASVQVKFHLPLFRTMTPLETVRLMEITFHQMVEDDGSHGRSFPVRWGKMSKKNRKRNQIYLLQGLPTVGPARAVDLLNYFGSVGEVFAASVDQLCQVPGIGKATAQKIRRIIEP